MTEPAPNSTQIFVIEMDTYVHAYHQCGRGASYACLSEDKSQSEIDVMFRNLLRHVRECAGIYFPMVDDNDG